MAKKLTLVDIKSENKVFDQKKRIDLSDEFYVVIYPHFSPSKIAELIKELITDKLRAKEAGLKFDSISMADWVLFSIIYKFADLGIPSEIKKKVQAFLQMVDSKYFGKIIESFPQESINDFQETFMRFNENFQELMKNNPKINDKDVAELLEKEDKIVQ